jgi:hypothetical protein
MRASAIGALALSFALFGCTSADEPELQGSVDPRANTILSSSSAVSDSDKLEVPPPPFSAGVFPCSDCHDPSLPVNTTRRTLKTAHQDVVLHHDEEHRWCLDCHSAVDRDRLHLASGELIEFDESYKLCGQCHGDKYRDWRAGVHGRRSGQWDGHKSYLLCVNCHNSHAPAFQPLAPLPPPNRPMRSTP